jgi:hypothetical protein
MSKSAQRLFHEGFNGKRSIGLLQTFLSNIAIYCRLSQHGLNNRTGRCTAYRNAPSLRGSQAEPPEAK